MSEFQQIIDSIVENLRKACSTEPVSNAAESVEVNLKALRNYCARGADVQCIVAAKIEFMAFLYELLFDDGNYFGESHERIKLMGWQLLANFIVNNTDTQKLIWSLHGKKLLNKCGTLPLGEITNIQLMIIYNLFIGLGSSIVCLREILPTIVRVWAAILEEKSEANYDYLHFLFEHFLVKGGRDTVGCYANVLDQMGRITFLDYLANYLRHYSPNGKIDNFIMQYMSKEFKMKSDCVLRTTSTTEQLTNVNPREAYALLQVIACGSGCGQYDDVYYADHALFLNVSSLLRCLVAAGKEADKSNIFAPMNKLEEVAPASTVYNDFESEVSFELKTLLVRCIANLLYKNNKNQMYCLETQLVPALLECTNMDARNPLIKEWSILAIRNACVNCPEVQAVISNLKEQGIAKNDIVDELNLEMGSLRIQPNK